MIATLKGFTQHLVPVNGIKINAVTGGSGPPILLLHGWPETWWEWHNVMPLLAEHLSVVWRVAWRRGRQETAQPAALIR